MFTGSIASNIAYGNESATREQVEAAAREANCEFVWGLPDGFDTPSGSLSNNLSVAGLTELLSLF